MNLLRLIDMNKLAKKLLEGDEGNPGGVEALWNPDQPLVDQLKVGIDQMLEDGQVDTRGDWIVYDGGVEYRVTLSGDVLTLVDEDGNVRTFGLNVTLAELSQGNVGESLREDFKGIQADSITSVDQMIEVVTNLRNLDIGEEVKEAYVRLLTLVNNSEVRSDHNECQIGLGEDEVEGVGLFVGLYNF